MSKLVKFAWVFFALALGTTTLFAQDWRNGKQAGNGRNNNCINRVSGLNDDQKTKIDGLNETHHVKMGELRTQRQLTTDAIEKSEIRTTMLKNVKAQRDEVKSLLTTEQQKDYELLQARGNYGNGRGNGNFQGRGQGRGQQFAGSQKCGACGFDAGTYVAHMAEVKVNKTTGEVQVLRVACAQEMGFCVNPEGTQIQLEGCITMGLGYALTEDIEFTGGNIKTANFGTYEIPKFSWVPEIEGIILDRNEPPQGGGEPAIICMGGVIANAIFDATGARLYQMPMTPERVLAAMKKLL